MSTVEVLHAGTSERARQVVRFYRPELDGLRFFAFLAVYVCHSIPSDAVLVAQQSKVSPISFLAAIKDAGNFGVCLFFMLSAFLITELLRREEGAYGHIHVGAFYARRSFRIWPLYFGITIAYVVGGCHFHAMEIERGRVLAYFLLAGNWYIALHPWIQTPLRSLWSISVEEQFYLIWPLLACYCGVRSLFKASLVIIPISLLTIFVVSADKAYAYNTTWLNSFAQFQFFAWGALLALTLRGKVSEVCHLTRCVSGGAGIAIWLLAAYATKIKRPGVQAPSMQFCLGYLLVAFGCLLLLLAVLGVRRRLVPKWMVYLGKISFGLYVFHETAFLLVDELQKHSVRSLPPVAAWAAQNAAVALILNKVLAFGVTVLLAMLSYRFWESPFLRLKGRFTWVPSRDI